MLEVLLVILFCWLGFKVLKLAFQVTWGLTKILASVLFVAAVPLLIVGLFFAGGLVLLLPVALIAAAFGLLRKSL